MTQGDCTAEEFDAWILLGDGLTFQEFQERRLGLAIELLDPEPLWASRIERLEHQAVRERRRLEARHDLTRAVAWAGW